MKRILFILLLTSNFIFSNSHNFMVSSTLPEEDREKVLLVANRVFTKVDSLLRLREAGSIKLHILKEEEFKNYLLENSLESDNDSIYVRYNKPDENRLIIKESFNENSFTYNLTYSYFDSFSKGAPDWLIDGFAQYFITDDIDSRIERIKREKSSEINWVTVFYLLNTDNREDSRLLWDTLSKIKWTIGDESKITDNFKSRNIEEKARAYINGYKTYGDRVEEAISLYKENRTKKCKELIDSLIKERDDYTLFYYKALIMTKEKRYSEADDLYKKALDLGAPEDTIYYSLGVNSYNARDLKKAEIYIGYIDESSSFFEKGNSLLKNKG